MCNLVYTDYTWRIGCGMIIIQLSNRLPRFTAIVSHIGGRVDFLPSLPFSSVILSIGVFPDYMVPSSKGLLEYMHLYASYRLFDSSVRPGTYSVRYPLGMCLLDVTRTLSTKHIKLKRRLNGIVCGAMTGWALTQIGRCWVCGIRSMIDFLHMFAMLPDAKMRAGL